MPKPSASDLSIPFFLVLFQFYVKSSCSPPLLKCDEEKPVCKKCQLYGTSCSFLQTHPLQRAPPAAQPPEPATATSPSRQPTIQSMLTPEAAPLSSSISSPALSSSFSDINYLSPTTNSFSMLDLELLHFYTTVSIYDFLDTKTYTKLFGQEVVQLAFQFPFLMHEILSISALHLAHLRPEKRLLYGHASDAHAATGLSLYQPQIARLTYKNCHACFAFSTWIWVHAWTAQDVSKPSTIFFSPNNQDDEDVHIKWIALHRGTNSIIETLWPVLKDGPLGGIFDPWVALDPKRPDPLSEEEKLVLDELPHVWQNSESLSPENKEALEKSISKLRRTYSMLTHNTNISRIAIVLAWFSAVTDEYLRMLERKIPEALLLAIHFCPTLKSLNHLWWMKGKAENLLQTLLDALGEGWDKWTVWPKAKVFGNEQYGGPDLGYQQSSQ